MRILYVAKHESGDNDDETAIAYALTKLGHEVIRVHEKPRHRLGGPALLDVQADFCLFHKWEDTAVIKSLRMPSVFWYFDMVDSNDPTLKARAQCRVDWMNRTAPACLLGFCTDGDWVQRYGQNLRHLMQGMDERMLGYGMKLDKFVPPIIFTGMVNHGQRRAQHVERLRKRYGATFEVLGDSGPRYRVHGHNLANLFASTRIVVAPDGPQSDLYWSNRVYLTLGLGGFLLHPFCLKLCEHYQQDKELIYYRSQAELEELIDFYLTSEADEKRQQLRRAGHIKTLTHNLYRHRCEELIKQVQEVL